MVSLRKKPKLSPLEEKQAQLKEEQNMAILDAVHKERLKHVDEYAQGYVGKEVEKVKNGELIPSIEGFKTPAEIEESKVKAKASRGSRFASLGKLVLKAAPYVNVPHFSGDMAQPRPANASNWQGTAQPPTVQPYGGLCPHCKHYMVFHDPAAGTCTPRSAAPHLCGTIPSK